MLRDCLFLGLIIASCCQIAHSQSIFQTRNSIHQADPLQEEFALVGPSFFARDITITTPPEDDVRPMAEWEEIEAITITWADYPETLSAIVHHAKHECKVYINCVSAEKVKEDLNLYQATYNENVIFLENQDFNSVWIRDYGPNSAYLNDVDSLIFVDWVYNRAQRPDDDILPEDFANQLEIPLFQTTTYGPWQNGKK